MVWVASNRWEVLLGGLACMISAGTVYGFGTISAALKNALGATESQKQLIGVAGNIGLWLNVTGGVLNARIGAQRTIALATLLSTIGYAGMYLTLQQGGGDSGGPGGGARSTAPTKPGWLPAFAAACWFVVGLGCGMTYISALFTAAGNFSPRHRTYVIGILTTMFGAASPLLAVFKGGMLGGDLGAYFGVCGVLVALLGAAGVASVRRLPAAPADPADPPADPLAAPVAAAVVVSGGAAAKGKAGAARGAAAGRVAGGGGKGGGWGDAAMARFLYLAVVLSVVLSVVFVAALTTKDGAALTRVDWAVLGLLALLPAVTARSGAVHSGGGGSGDRGGDGDDQLGEQLLPGNSDGGSSGSSGGGGGGGGGVVGAVGAGSLAAALRTRTFALLAVVVATTAGGNVLVLNILSTIVKDRGVVAADGDFAVVVMMTMSCSARFFVGILMFRWGPLRWAPRFMVAAPALMALGQLLLCPDVGLLVFVAAGVLGLSDGTIWCVSAWVCAQLFGAITSAVYGTVVAFCACSITLIAYVIEPIVYNSHATKAPPPPGGGGGGGGDATECAAGIACFRTTHLIVAGLGCAAVAAAVAFGREFEARTASLANDDR